MDDCTRMDLWETILFLQGIQNSLASGPHLPWSWLDHAIRHLEHRLDATLRSEEVTQIA